MPWESRRGLPVAVVAEGGGKDKKSEKSKELQTFHQISASYTRQESAGCSGREWVPNFCVVYQVCTCYAKNSVHQAYDTTSLASPVFHCTTTKSVRMYPLQ